MTEHHTHHDPATRALIAQAEARGAERVAQAVERLASRAPDGDEVVRVTISPIPGVGLGQRTSTYVSVDALRALLAEHRDEHPAAEPPSDVTEDEVAKAIRDTIKRMTIPPVFPGGPGGMGANEFDLARAVCRDFHVIPRADR